MRLASPGDMRRVFLMGYDTWGEGRPAEAYIEGCFRSAKYKLGSWYVLEMDGTPVSALIIYRDVFRLPPAAAGIGSVATSRDSRRRGHASELIREVSSRLRRMDGSKLFFLYADVDPNIYARLGFVALPDHLQRYQPSICMASGNQSDLARVLSTSAPDYF
ncbi:MAG TPA: GNAT family N-acetyltransferase [Candidatus Limnocylindria bacterium]|nr:GNAT family N-acetyltransferase [Candidatus Limnocylindria bacterium]